MQTSNISRTCGITVISTTPFSVGGGSSSFLNIDNFFRKQDRYVNSPPQSGHPHWRNVGEPKLKTKEQIKTIRNFYSFNLEKIIQNDHDLVTLARSRDLKKKSHNTIQDLLEQNQKLCPK